ncbi:MAG TPA: hypothetical protein GX392_06270, partial [Clostridiales bacterium]|nr:hypothetical protein [Clostridiales bacterium]
MIQKKNKTIFVILIIIITISIISIYLAPKICGNYDSYTDFKYPDEILVKLNRYTECHPKDIESMLRLAYDYSTKHEYEKADTLLLNILQKEPGYTLAVYLRGIVMIEQFQFPEAVELFKDILLDNENNHRALLFLSRIYFVYDHQQSLKYAKKATKAADDFFMELDTLAEEYEPLNFMFYKRWENMVAEFDTKFEDDPAAASLEIMEYLISTPLKIELCKNALNTNNPSDPQKMQELLERMGMLYTEVGMNEEAINTYKTLIETTPTYGRGYILLADRSIKTNNLTLIDELYDDIQKQQGLEIEKDIID